MEKQIEVHKNGVSCGKELLIICCSNRYEYSIQTGDWYITDNIKFVISKSLHFSGHVSNECALEKLRQIKSAEILANTSVKLEEKLDNIPAVPKESLLGKQKMVYQRIIWWKVDPNLYEEGYQNTPSKRICL